jgi:large subunit ribosomal protein L3
MGHRKRNAPKRGSLSYIPKKRAKSWIGKTRFWPATNEGPKLLSFAGYKAGMTHLVAMDDKKGSLTYGKEISVPATVIETPPMIVFGIRTYTKSFKGMKTYCEAWMDNPPKDLDRLLTLPKKARKDELLNKIRNSLDQIDEIRLLILSQPRIAKTGRKKPELIEMKIGGGTIKEQFDYSVEMLGKNIDISNIFKEGDLVDTIAITKGKGIQGPVKRWGVKRLPHKSRKTVRGVGCIGPWNPSVVMYSIPRAGQMGFHQRTEYNKQILKIDAKGNEITPKGDFIRYGKIDTNYALIKGSVPGTERRLVVMRYPARSPETEIPPPKIEYISTKSRQGD